MKKKRQNAFLKALNKVMSIGQITKIAVDVTDSAYRSISEPELKGIMKAVYVAPPTGVRTVDHVQIPSMLEPIGRELMDRRMDHEKLMAVAPEIEQAAAILVPSILSPNDFRKNIFEVAIGGGNESDPVKTAIVKLINTHFDTELELSTKISTWVYEAMFKMGAKAIMILPTSTIAALRDGVGSTEELKTVSKGILDQIEGSLEFANSSDKSDIKIRDTMYKDEDIINRVAETQTVVDIISQSKHSRETELQNVRKKLKPGIEKGAAYFVKQKAIAISTDPLLLLKPKLANCGALESINSEILKKLGADPRPVFRDRSDGISAHADKKVHGYAYQPYIDLSDYIKDDNAAAFPAVIELPYEAVIPVIVEGSPTNHIGYFIMLNEHGAPISAEADNYGEMLSSASGTQRVNNLYNAFYGSTQMSIQGKMSTDAKTEILNSIYDSFINNMIKSKLDAMGLDKHRVELSSSLSRVMFTRLLKNTQTRVLFVPKKLMLYLTFKYNKDGTGRSKIDNIKFPLSLKMTLIITRLISLIESSINRRNLNITLDDGIGNPLELLRSIKKDVMANKIYGISYDPSTIIKSILDKELTITPSKIPGVENFELSEVANNVDYPKPDDGLMNEITNMYTLSLGVPPSSMNRLNEDEFSRSVASNNIFFSNQLKTYQKDVCTFMTGFIVTYTGFSKKLKTSILAILEDETGMSATVDKPTAALEAKSDDKVLISDENTPAADESVVSEVKGKKEKKEKDEKKDKDGEKKATSKLTKDEQNDPKTLSPDDRLNNVLANIKFTLPSPTLAQDKSAFEELKDYVEIIDTVLMNMFPDDMTSDTELTNIVKIVRSSVKRKIIQEHLKGNSLLSDLNFDALSNVDVIGPIDVTQKLMNIKNGIAQMVKGFNAEEPADTGTEGGASSTW